jgi:hypothetical protein
MTDSQWNGSCLGENPVRVLFLIIGFASIHGRLILSVTSCVFACSTSASCAIKARSRTTARYYVYIKRRLRP